MTRTGAWMVVVVCCVMSSGVTWAGGRGDARQLFLAGKRHFSAGQYERALQEFSAAYAARPAPPILFDMGVASARLGRFTDAIGYYQRYLTERPDAPDRGAVERQLLALRRLVAANPPTPPASVATTGKPEPTADDDPKPAPPAPVAAQPAAAPRPAAAPEPAVTRTPPPESLVQEPPTAPRRDRGLTTRQRVATGLMLGGGLALLGGGAGLVTDAHLRADHVTTEQQFRGAQSAPTLNVAGIALLSAGGVLTVGAIIYYAVAHRRSAGVHATGAARSRVAWVAP